MMHGSPARLLVVGPAEARGADGALEGRWEVHHVDSIGEALGRRLVGVFAVMCDVPPDLESGRILMNTVRRAYDGALVLGTVPGQDIDRIIRALNDLQVDRCLTLPLDPLEVKETLAWAVEQFELRSIDYSSLALGVTRVNRRILCVDDEEDIRDLYQRVLGPTPSDPLAEIRRRRAGGAPPPTPTHSFEVTLAANGEDAVAAIKAAHDRGHPFAAAFFDMKMPGGIDGLEAIRRGRQIDPALPCAVVTAYTDRSLDDIQAVFTQPDQWLYFNKPFTSGELLQSARNLVTGWNQRRAAACLKDYARRIRGLVGRLGHGREPGPLLELLRHISAKTLTQVLQADGGGLVLLDVRSQRFKVMESRSGQATDLVEALARKVQVAREMVTFDRAGAPADLSALMESWGIGSVLVLPIHGWDEVIGLIYAWRTDAHQPFRTEEAQLLGELADLASQTLGPHQQRRSTAVKGPVVEEAARSA